MPRFHDQGAVSTLATNDALRRNERWLIPSHLASPCVLEFNISSIVTLASFACSEGSATKLCRTVNVNVNARPCHLPSVEHWCV